MTQTDGLIANAKCIEQCLPTGMQMPALIALFAQIAGMSTPINTQTLINNAVCIQQCIPPGMWTPVLIALLAGASGGATAQGGPVLGGNGPPTTPPPLPNLYAIWNDFSPGGEQWWWNPNTQTWS